MDRIMLVMDDFTELQFLSSVLQKLGFDVLSFNKDASVGSAALGFAPGLLIATAKGRNVDGLSLAAKIRKQIAAVKTIIVYPRGQSEFLTDEIKNDADAFVETPLEPAEVLPVIARLLRRHDEKALIEKYKKIITSGQLGDRGVGFGLSSTPAERSPSARERRYQKFLELNDEPADGVLAMDVLHKAAAIEAAGESDADREMRELKKKFVRTLFKK